MVDPDPSPSGTGRAAEAHEATIKSWRISRWMIGVAVFAAVCTAIGLIIAFYPDHQAQGVAQGDSAVNSGGTGNNPSQCGVVGAHASCQILQQAKAQGDTATTDDTAIRAQLRARPEATHPPTTPGPWPYAVLDTGALGLFARTTATAEATRVGNAGNLDIIWADCLATTDFTPQGLREHLDVGPQWIKARWKHLDQGTTRGLSEPTQPTTAYFYLGYLEPLGHNGDIPAC
ncbi:hypothetical protein JOD54_005125 [Actinokineospora baliensis]|uniref:hypothetical protein n=1 Tax=Actinokineospora baliensis TaxID=547056 RepID=UPI00195AD5B1|nr:hypothetical protein [Actinokineospora baliensis]MBM7774921.1 hypothetical protein [Actinokineospora baliensis]